MSGKDQAVHKAEVVAINAASAVQHVGCDDGHFGIKLITEDATGKLVESIVPSRVAMGAQMISLSENEDNVYETSNGQIYTVSESLAHIDTRFDGYAESDINRVLIHHALLRAGMGGKQVRIVTGLPVDDFYKSGKPDSEFISRKVKSLTQEKVVNKNATVELAEIKAHAVQPEAICAFYDLLINDDGSTNEDIQELIKSGSVGVIDIGGKTTDSAVIINGGRGLDTNRSGTSKIGALSLNVAVESRLKAEFKVDSLTSAQIDKAVMTSKLRIFGTEHDCSAIISEEKENLASQIIEATKRRMRDGADLERVFFVGGGSLLLREQLANLYPHAEFIQNPQFSNARGMYKIAKYVMK